MFSQAAWSCARYVHYNKHRTSLINLLDDLYDIPYEQGTRLASFDIENTYPNIPTNKLIPILENMSLNHQLDAETINTITKITCTVLEQNYFTFQNINYSQSTGLAMGASSSAVLSEIYLQHLEHTKIVDILKQHDIIGYFRYVDDIVIVYNENSTDVNEIHKTLNNMTPRIKFTLEKETHNQINFMDLTIRNINNKLFFNIYRKPTATDMIIPKDSCHPPEQKHAAIRHMINRMNTYRLNDHNKNIEYRTIEQIIINNDYETSVIQQLNNPKHKANTNNRKDSYAEFTYFGKETRAVTKLFKETQLRVAYKVNNTINKQLVSKLNNQNSQQQYERSGVYSLTCPDCLMKYIGQTGRTVEKRFQEYFHDFKYNIRKSNFATHLLDNNHSIGPINEMMQILYTTRKTQIYGYNWEISYIQRNTSQQPDQRQKHRQAQRHLWRN